MRKTLFFLLIITIIFSCKKENNTNEDISDSTYKKVSLRFGIDKDTGEMV